MLLLSKNLSGKPIASVQSGHRVGLLGAPIIDPRNLKITAFHASSPALGHDLVVHTSDIRDFSHNGVILDHNDQLMTLDDDLVRLKEVVGFDFKLIDKQVYSEDKKKLGKVSDYAVDTSSFFIVKLHVNRPIVKSLGVSQLIINRPQIVKVTDIKIIVRSTAIKAKGHASVRQALFGKSVSLEADQSQAE